MKRFVEASPELLSNNHERALTLTFSDCVSRSEWHFVYDKEQKAKDKEYEAKLAAAEAKLAEAERRGVSSSLQRRLA